MPGEVVYAIPAALVVAPFVFLAVRARGGER